MVLICQDYIFCTCVFSSITKFVTLNLCAINLRPDLFAVCQRIRINMLEVLLLSFLFSSTNLYLFILKKGMQFNI